MSRKAEAQARRRYARNQRRRMAPAQATEPAKQPTGRINVMLSCPTYSGEVNWTIAHMFGGAIAANTNPNFPITFATHYQVGTHPVEFARNQIVETFLDQTQADWLYMIDADQVVPGNFWQLVGVQDADIVTGLTYTWVGNAFEPGRLRVNQYGLWADPASGCAMHKDRENPDMTSQCTCEQKCFNLPMPDDISQQKQPYMIPVTGTGCVAIRRHVFRPKEEGGLGRNPFYFTRYPNGRVRGGEDINFSVDAQRAGFKIACHPAVRFGHVKKMDLAQVDEFYRARKAWDAAGNQFTPEQLLSIA